MKRLWLALALLAGSALAGPALAEDGEAFARWGENSGSLPPEYAWDYSVSFFPDRRGEVEYCKGYANEAPGCAVSRFRLSKKAFAALQEALAPLEADLAAKPAVSVADFPVGGGSVGGMLRMNGREVKLLQFPNEADAPRVGAVLGLLRENTPASAIRSAKSKARQP